MVNSVISCDRLRFSAFSGLGFRYSTFRQLWYRFRGVFKLNTDWNCLFSSSALACGSVCRIPVVVSPRGATPIESFLQCFRYVQKFFLILGSGISGWLLPSSGVSMLLT